MDLHGFLFLRTWIYMDFSKFRGLAVSKKLA